MRFIHGSKSSFYNHYNWHSSELNIYSVQKSNWTTVSDDNNSNRFKIGWQKRDKWQVRAFPPNSNYKLCFPLRWMAYDCQDTINQQRQCLAFLWNSGIVLKVITEEILITRVSHKHSSPKEMNFALIGPSSTCIYPQLSIYQKFDPENLCSVSV